VAYRRQHLAQSPQASPGRGAFSQQGRAPEETSEPLTDGERVRRCIARLPRRRKLALFLHYYADLDYDAIAGVLEVSPGTVGKLLWEARTTLRRMLDE
jgi:RNA polymerase sigma factor (sigma-70 family)